MIHEQGLVMTELNSDKGIYCEMCSHATKDNEHKITISTRKAGCDFYQHICVPCAKDLIACLQLSLMDALLTEKEK